MNTHNHEEEIKEFLEEWNRSILEKDLQAAAQLRVDCYSVTTPNGDVLTRDEEIAVIASPELLIKSINIQSLEVPESGGDSATVVFVKLIEGENSGRQFSVECRSKIAVVKTDGRWRATSCSTYVERTAGQMSDLASSKRPDEAEEFSRPGSAATFAISNLVPRSIKAWIKRKMQSAASESAPSFQELAFMPYTPRLDFVLPASPPADSEASSSELPIPPKELWLGYNYLAHGNANVSTMLEIVYASDFAFKKGNRILDFGCGAGRMIRYLKDLSETCEIWGTDIQAEHIYWCKQNLSPPFNFATTTKVPHLPFEDRSFQLIYCGSVFTHIDDLADAWLLELQRILAPEGRLYITIHDQHTIELMEEGRHSSSDLAKWTKSKELYQKSKTSFGMLSLGRDNNSQVFYNADYFAKTLRSMFEVISVTQEAYFHQTAFLLKRKISQHTK
ncbi:MAG TPA: methyltransferase domain-containing protein [Pyrinomonadaceae bacterium]|nr:methyltransferase domain-containing protein [Pyrinomonadaceae bacterium]